MFGSLHGSDHNGVVRIFAGHSKIVNITLVTVIIFALCDTIFPLPWVLMRFIVGENGPSKWLRLALCASLGWFADF